MTGNGTADITYASAPDGNLGNSQLTNVQLPWHKTVTGKGLLNAYSLVVSLDGGTDATCAVTINGKVVSHNTAHGAYANATCSGGN